MSDLIKFDAEYVLLFSQLKEKILSAQLRASYVVNKEVIKLYWDIGKHIIDKQRETKWGSNIVGILSKDLRNAFPETRGFSERNIERMKQFAQLYPSLAIPAQAVPELPWGHIVLLIQRVKNYVEREWYARQCFEHGWSRPTLETHITRNLYQHQAISENKASNFLTLLPPAQSALAQDLLKNPYNFDFLGLHDDALERDIEHAATNILLNFY